MLTGPDADDPDPIPVGTASRATRRRRYNALVATPRSSDATGGQGGRAGVVEGQAGCSGRSSGALDLGDSVVAVTRSDIGLTGLPGIRGAPARHRIGNLPEAVHAGPAPAFQKDEFARPDTDPALARLAQGPGQHPSGTISTRRKPVLKAFGVAAVEPAAPDAAHEVSADGTIRDPCRPQPACRATPSRVAALVAQFATAVPLHMLNQAVG